jgi:dihydroneopterin aldolase/2-amino-4-hydroxy-6-hydroxymethyldihydropteridine diphosphokinase
MNNFTCYHDRMRTYLAVVSNVGDAFSYINSALDELKRLLKYFEYSDLYKTRSHGVVNQANFLNCAVFGDTSLQPLALLKIR